MTNSESNPTDDKVDPLENRTQKERLFQEGLRLARQGDVSGACELLNQAHQIDPDDRNVEVTLQVMRRRAESPDAESPDADAAPDAAPDDAPDDAHALDAALALADTEDEMPSELSDMDDEVLGLPASETHDEVEARYARPASVTPHAVAGLPGSASKLPLSEPPSAPPLSDSEPTFDSEAVACEDTSPGERDDAEPEEGEEEKPGVRARVASAFSRVARAPFARVARIPFSRIAQAPKGAWQRLRTLKREPKPRVLRENDVPYFRDGKREHVLTVQRLEELDSPATAILYFGAPGLASSPHAARHVTKRFAHERFVAANVRYRTLPSYPFPAALVDAARAFQWFVEHADAYGVDPDRIVLAGETIGANLALGVTLSCCYQREEKWARRLYDLGFRPHALLLFSGYLQTTEPHRLGREQPDAKKSTVRPLVNFANDYCDFDPRLPGATQLLADPVVALESASRPSRPLPPCLAVAGTDDVLADDSRRLETSYSALGGACTLRMTEGKLMDEMSGAWKGGEADWIGETFAFVRALA